MEKKKFIKKLEKNIGIKKIKSTINSINAALFFFVFLAFYSIYMNHTGWMLSYGVIVAAISFIALAIFLSRRIKMQVDLNNMKLDYRKYIVKPVAEDYFEKGSFSRTGSLTEREIVSTLLFSDGPEFQYSSCNELKGVYKGVTFANSDMTEDCKSNNFHVKGRIFELDIPTKNVNPVIFTTATAPIIEFHNSRVHTITPADININKMFRVYAFDENEANELLTENMIYKLRELVSLQLGKVLKISFHSGKVYVFYTTESPTYEEVLTKKHDVEKEIPKVHESFNAVGKIIDIL
ncbi:MAG: DUF3137 domain-containing protein [Eubacterium sp.]|nr:DUF3137 domain-containing protein [Eubacterium sp.]